ncbi:hypothetical protein SASPL_140951 [Salvia splendens]|uniref:Uncharacterized protein n=1 Tax=Salvia splendens TaxID=180675 RepID=A0A8X8WS00_SALSN|nr:uncharacterized protein LOC121766538 [Salvia splendens]KAG6399470.1 hypothetical protein SASPL_140951 [Salvia splendens]
MALLVSSVVGLALRPLLFAKLSCQVGARGLCIVVLTWLEVLRYALCLHFVILWRLAIWGMAVLSLPVRAFRALYRERMLEMQLHRLRNEMEDVLFDSKELEEQLHEAIEERSTMEMLVIELEKEHDEAILKIKLLEGEVQNLKDEAQRLKEIQGKILSSYVGQDGRHLTITHNIGKSPYRLDYDREVIEDVSKDEMRMFARIISKEYGVLAQERKVALSRSLFSVLLSLVVGLIVWKAKAPCTPLVIALFVVVTMSLRSVLQLCARVEHRPASESLALLSINWFILGTLADPMFPVVARFLAPVAEFSTTSS